MNVLVVVGTRPEAIKLAPVVRRLKAHGSHSVVLCSTGQHREMLSPVFDYFEMQPDIALETMRSGQTLAALTSSLLAGLDDTLKQVCPTYVIGQGDTTTVFSTATAAFYHQIPFVHVEAGLRSFKLDSPWPEEFNRRVAATVAALNFAPTQGAAENLLKEGVDAANVFVTGNTVIDALFWTRNRELQHEVWEKKYCFLGQQRLVLVTCHRRENFGNGVSEVCHALKELSTRFPDVQIIFPVHLNPHVNTYVQAHLLGIPNIHLVAPASYPEFVWLMNRAYFIISDSGGVQEEAPSLGKPVLITRDTTERPEAVVEGAAILVGACSEAIIRESALLLMDDSAYGQRQVGVSPFGDGQAAARIVKVLNDRF